MKAENIDGVALLILRNTKHRLTQQQYKTLRGQVLAGDATGAMKGLYNIIHHQTVKLEVVPGKQVTGK